MNVLVTGGCGFIGSAFLRNFVPVSQHRFLNADALTYAANLANVEGLEKHENYAFERVDVADEDDVHQLFKLFAPDVIVHFAAESHVDRSIAGPAPFLHTNVFGTYNLLEASRRLAQKPRFHQVSTDEVYGSLGVHHPLSIEADPYRPSSPYSASKASADHLVRAWGRTFELPFTISVASNNYGPYQFPEKFIPLMICNALEGKRLPIYGTGRNRRDWIYVDDHVRAIWEIVWRGEIGETYNVGSGESYENLTILALLTNILAEETGLSAADLKALWEFVPDRPGHDFRYALDTRKWRSLTASIFGDGLEPVPTRSVEIGLRATVQWYTTHRDWARDIQSGRYRQRVPPRTIFHHPV